MQTAQAMQKRREDIIAAAQKLLAQEDLSAFSVRKLAASAGVSVATIYNLIGNRQAVLFAIVNDLTEQMKFNQTYANEISMLDRVEGQVKGLLKFTKSQEQLLRSAILAFDELSREADWSSSTSRIIKLGESSFVDTFRKGLDSGEMRGDVPAGFLSALMYRVYLDATINWAYRQHYR